MPVFIVSEQDAKRLGEEVFSGMYGNSMDPDAHCMEPARLDHIFPVASITKPVVATLVMQLMEDGELDVYDPIGKYIPQFNTEETKAIQIWHFATHSSGIVDEDRNGAIREYIKKYGKERKEIHLLTGDTGCITLEAESTQSL